MFNLSLILSFKLLQAHHKQMAYALAQAKIEWPNLCKNNMDLLKSYDKYDSLVKMEDETDVPDLSVTDVDCLSYLLSAKLKIREDGEPRHLATEMVMKSVEEFRQLRDSVMDVDAHQVENI